MEIIIGTRKSKLALWQANHVASKLRQLGHNCQLTLIESEGDKIIDTPLPLIGGKGLFTKALDEAILNQSIHIAVHSYKDVPTELDEGLIVTAILEREKHTDAIVVKNGLDFLTHENAVIATSSNRRKALWLNKFPNHRIVDIRGNVPTRIQKLNKQPWDATILASAGLIRLNLQHEIAQELHWMTPAPAQGAIAVMCHSSQSNIIQELSKINDSNTALCTNIERDFLNALNGGCSAPLGAYAQIKNNKVQFEGVVASIDGKEKIEIRLEASLNTASNLGLEAANTAVKKGAKRLIDSANNYKNA